MRDWARFAIDQMKGKSGSGKLLSAAGYRHLHTGVDGTIYGLGWGVRTSLDGLQGRFLTHAGSNGYWVARIALLPDSQSGLLIAANAGDDGGADGALSRLRRV